MREIAAVVGTVIFIFCVLALLVRSDSRKVRRELHDEEDEDG